MGLCGNNSARQQCSLCCACAVLVLCLCSPTLPGTVVLQWYRQDGCWQVPSSWSCHGALPPSGQISSDALASLPKQQPCVSCLYVLVVPAVAVPASAADPTAAAASSAAAGGGGGPPVVLQGELVLSLERAKRVQLQVRADAYLLLTFTSSCKLDLCFQQCAATKSHSSRQPNAAAN